MNVVPADTSCPPEGVKGTLRPPGGCCLIGILPAPGGILYRIYLSPGCCPARSALGPELLKAPVPSAAAWGCGCRVRPGRCHTDASVGHPVPIRVRGDIRYRSYLPRYGSTRLVRGPPEHLPVDVETIVQTLAELGGCRQMSLHW